MSAVKLKAEGYVSFPLVVNIELTDKCPLNCPYCYKDLEHVNNIDFTFLCSTLKEFAQNGGKKVLLSGGEPLLYPRLAEAVRVCCDLGLSTAISTSGCGLNERYLKELLENGLTALYISLNCHIREINDLSRDGYDYAVSAMKLCNYLNKPYWLNTVVRHDNIIYLNDFIEFAKMHGALGIELLLNKPDNSGNVSSPMTKDDFVELINLLETNESYLSYQTCFIPLKTYFNKLRNNKKLNGLLRGCTAGKYSMAIFSDGRYAQCPHSNEKEKFDSITTYWTESKILLRHRESGNTDGKKCDWCAYKEYCSPCVLFSNSNNCLSDLMKG